MSTSKKKASLLEEYKKAKLLDTPKEIRHVLLKIRDQLKDCPTLVDIIEIDVLICQGNFQEAYDLAQILWKTVSQNTTDSSPEFKEIFNIAGYLVAVSCLESKSDDDHVSVLLNIRDDLKTDEVQTALRHVFSGMYLELRGVHAKYLLKGRDFKGCVLTIGEFTTQVKNSKQILDVVDAKTLLRVENHLLVLPQVLYEQGEVSESISKLREILQFKTTIKFHPKFEKCVLRELSRMLTRHHSKVNTTMNFPRNTFEEALSILFSLANENTNDETLFDDLVFLLGGERFYEILADLFKTSLIKNFDNVNLWTQLGLALMSAGRPEDAILVFRECLTLTPFNAKLSLLSAKIAMNHLGDPKRAQEFLLKSGQWSSFWKTRAHYYLAVIHSQLGINEPSLPARKNEQYISLEHCMKADSIDPFDPYVHFQIALQYAELREIKKAFTSVKTSLQYLSHVPGWILLSLLYTSVKEYTSVSETLKLGLADFPNNVHLLLLQAELEELDSEPKSLKSYKALLEILEQNPLKDQKEEVEILLRVSTAFRRLKRFPEAIDLLKKKSYPGLVAEQRFLAGRIFEDTKKIAEAIDEYEATLIKNANHIGAQERLGVIYTSQQNYVLGRSFLSSAVRLDPTNFETWFQLGTCLKKIGEYEESSDCFMTSIQLSKTAPLIPFHTIKRKII